MSDDLLSGGLLWKCACGKRVFNHYRTCVDCGRDRPKPPEPEPPKQPSVFQPTDD